MIPSQVVIDVVDPILGEHFLKQIPILIGGDSGFDLVSLSNTEEGGPLMEALSQQRKTIPAVRVYADPKNAETVTKRFSELFPAQEQRKHRDDDYTFSEY